MNISDDIAEGMLILDINLKIVCWLYIFANSNVMVTLIKNRI